jgi:hypothetical protein
LRSVTLTQAVESLTLSTNSIRATRRVRSRLGSLGAEI